MESKITSGYFFKQKMFVATINMKLSSVNQKNNIIFCAEVDNTILQEN